MPVPDDLVQGLLLIVSELVTNAVRHAALLSPELAVEVAVGAEWVRVAVEDNHPYRPTALEADHGQTGGRGLLLVREVTREAGGVVRRRAHRERRQGDLGRPAARARAPCPWPRPAHPRHQPAGRARQLPDRRAAPRPARS